MKTLILIVSLSLIAISGQSQSHKLDWAISQGGPQHEQTTGIAADKAGNVYTTGTFSDTVDFDPGPGSYLLYPGKLQQTFISKVDASGKLLWAKALGSSMGECSATAICTDSNNNFYICGTYDGPMDMDPGPATHMIHCMAGSTNSFVAKYDSSGALLWTAFAESSTYPGVVKANSIAVDRQGNVFTTGYVSWGVKLYDSRSAHMMTLSGKAALEMFVWALDADGMHHYAMNSISSSSTKGSAIGIGITADTSGNLYCTGTFKESITFSTGAALPALTATGDDDIFLLKLDGYTEVKWAIGAGSTTKDEGYAVTPDTSGGVIAVGAFTGTTDFDPGPGSAVLSPVGDQAGYVCRFDSSGKLSWVKAFTKHSGTYGYALCNAVAGGKDGSVFIGGRFGGSIDFDPGPGTYPVNSGYGLFLLKMDASGNMVWTKTIGNDTAPLRLEAIHTDVNGNLYATGYYQGRIDFNPGAGRAELVPVAFSDLFTMKLVTCTSSIGKDTLSACGNYTFNGKTYSSSGIYDLVTENSGGCDSFITLHLTIEPAIDSVSRSGSTLSAKTSGAVYQWLQCPDHTPIPGATAKDFIAAASGAYAVVVSKGSCRDTSDCVNVTGTGINDPASDRQIAIYPNPAGKQVTILLPESVTAGQVQVMGINGQILLQHDGLAGQSFDINISGLANGLYFLKVSDTDRVIGLHKLVKQ